MRVRAAPQVTGDLRRIKSGRLLKKLLALMRRLGDEPFLGRPLQYRRGVGNLSDCRRLYVTSGAGRPNDYRIVYQLVPSEEAPREVWVVSVGPRADAKAYRDAVKRLGRD